MPAPAEVAPPPETVAQAVNVDPAYVLTKIQAWAIDFRLLLPNIGVAAVVLLLFILGGWLVMRGFRRWATRRNRANLGDVFGAFLKWLIILIGMLIALTIIIPSLNAGDLFAGLGISSVAIGFAFKDILQNWLAGLLLLFRQPFRPGDEIIVDGYEGTVKRIETRATVLRTYDGRDAIIPNSDVYSHAVTVNTAYELRRTEYDVGIGYEDSIAEARRVILTALVGIEGIEAEPAPEVLAWELAPSTVNLRIRWWSRSRRLDVVHSRSRVIEAAKAALEAADIDLPFETQVVIWKDPPPVPPGPEAPPSPAGGRGPG